MKILFLALAFIATNISAAHAQDFWTASRDVQVQAVPPGMTLQKVMNFSNDRDAIVNRLSVMFDSNTLLTGMYIDQTRRFVEPTAFGPGAGAVWLRDIESTEGGVLFEGQGHKVILIQGKLDRATQTGRFQVRYLANGLTNNYEACDVLLKKDDKGWYAQNAYTNRRITSAKLITWSLGVTTVQGICPAKSR